MYLRNLILWCMNMGVLERIENIIKANLNDRLANTEDTEKVLEQLISEMESELTNARTQMAAAMREGKRLRLLCVENEKIAEKWQEKAVLAVQYGKDDLAREALLRKRSASALAEDYRRECESHEVVFASLKSALKALEMKIQEARRRKNDLVMRKRRAAIQQLLGQDIVASKSSVFKRMEDRITHLSAEAEALAEINSNGSVYDGQREAELDAELAKLKARMKNEKS
jgi:phage shock protein A